jgi:polyvinyl alcohol dehydrogenase (cytochrome)
VAVQPGVTPTGSVAWTSNISGTPFSLDGIIQSRPLIVGNMVVVGTENNSLYGFTLTTGNKVWGPVNIGTPESQTHVDSFTHLSGCGDVFPLGITSNLALGANNDVYAVGEVQTGTASNADPPQHKLVAVDPTTGTVTLSPTAIDPPTMTTVDQVAAEQQRAGLLAANGNIYIGFGGLSGDCGTYSGYLVAARQTDGSIVGSFQSATPAEGSNDGAIWGTGGPIADASGNVYASTGNSTNNPPAGVTDYSDGVVEVTPSALSGGANITVPSDYFQPAEWRQDNDVDADLGSNAPVLVANGTKLFMIGKQHNAFLLSTSALGGPDHETPLGRLNGACSGVSDGQNATLGSSAYFNCSSSGMVQVTLS